MYVASVKELYRIIDERHRERGKIRSVWNRFIEQRYGISDIDRIVGEYFSSDGVDHPIGFLARQIASVCTEDIAFNLLAEALGFTPLTATFTRDSFNANNGEKLSRVDVPWISWSYRSRAYALRYERLTPLTNEELEGIPLDRIKIDTRGTLPEIHANFRQKAIPHAAVRDASELHTQLLRLAAWKPSQIFREKDGKERRVELCGDELIEDRDRPPASWYYPIYLSWFLDGSMVLFETYDNPHKDVLRAKEAFVDAVGEIWRATNYTPIIVKVPPLSREMLFCNRHILENGEGALSVLKKGIPLHLDDTVLISEVIAQKAIHFR
jgi:hypothetical protein